MTKPLFASCPFFKMIDNGNNPDIVGVCIHRPNKDCTKHRECLFISSLNRNMPFVRCKIFLEFASEVEKIAYTKQSQESLIKSKIDLLRKENAQLEADIKELKAKIAEYEKNDA